MVLFSRGFSDCILDKPVILDTPNDMRDTAWNDTAATLVKSNPNRFQYVDTPGYWKGVSPERLAMIANLA